VSDYAHDTRASLDEEITRLRGRVTDARAEADYARQQPGLESAAKNADGEANRLEAEIADLADVANVVDRGYPYWERQGLELALEALGDPSQWEALSEVVADGMVFPHDLETRLPLDVQHRYAQALETRLFDRFDILSIFETDGVEDVIGTTQYLVAGRRLPGEGSAAFLVAEWSDTQGAAT